MKTLQIASLPLIGLTQEAYEQLVVSLSVELQGEYNVAKRTKLLEKIAECNTMINHIIDITKNAKNG